MSLRALIVCNLRYTEYKGKTIVLSTKTKPSELMTNRLIRCFVCHFIRKDRPHLESLPQKYMNKTLQGPLDKYIPLPYNAIRGPDKQEVLHS